MLLKSVRKNVSVCLAACCFCIAFLPNSTLATGPASQPFEHRGTIDGSNATDGTSFSIDGGRLLAAAAGNIDVWDTHTLKQVAQIPGQNALSLRLIKGGDLFISGGGDAISTWKLSPLKLESVTHVGDGDADLADVSETGALFTYHGKTISIWALGAKRPHVLLEHDSKVVDCILNRSGTLAVTQDWDRIPNYYHVWNTATGKEVCRPIECDWEVRGNITVPSFDPGGTKLLVPRHRGFSIVELSSGRIVAEGRLEGLGLTALKTAVFAVGGKKVIAATRDADGHFFGPTQVFDSITGKFVRTLCRNAVISQSGDDCRWVLSQPPAPDPAEIWDLDSGSRLQTLGHDRAEGNDFAEMSPDGHVIAEYLGNGKIRIWRAKDR